MKKIITIVGARPQFIKASAISRTLQEMYAAEIQEIIVHTGQHYDYGMSDVFFEELAIPSPKYNLNVGSKTHGTQTGEMMIAIEEVLLKEQPDLVVVYGDTNSTIAGALAAAKLHIPVAHVEAGLRSFNKKMPEEINRILTDHLSALLFVPTETGMKNLSKEGFTFNASASVSNENPLMSLCGDVMYDNALFFSKDAKEWEVIKEKYNLTDLANYLLFTIHRPANTDDKEKLTELVETMLALAEKGYSIVFPVHPRTKKAMENKLDEELFTQLMTHQNIKTLPPLSYIEMLHFEKNALMVATDSGGVQKEGYFFKKPILILREETEWTELLTHNNAVLCGSRKQEILEAVKNFSENQIQHFPNTFGDGHAAHVICKEVYDYLF